MRLAGGPACLRIEASGDRVRASAWGPAAAEALDLAPGLVGELDRPEDLVVQDKVVRDLQRRFAGVHLTQGTPLLDILVRSIISQKVTGLEARRSYAALLRAFGEPAPGSRGLLLPPPPEKLARLPYWAFHPFGIERRRAEAIRTAAAAAGRFGALGDLAPEERIERLTALRGIGRWTAAEAVRIAFGDPDAVSVGDYHLPRLVCRTLAGTDDGDDQRMLELLEPYRGQRARVVLLIEKGGRFLPRRGPRVAPRSIAAI